MLNEPNLKEDAIFKFHDELNYIAQIRRQKFKISFHNYLLLGISNDTSLLPEVHHFSRVSDEFFQFHLVNISNRNIIRKILFYSFPILKFSYLMKFNSRYY